MSVHKKKPRGWIPYPMRSLSSSPKNPTMSSSPSSQEWLKTAKTSATKLIYKPNKTDPNNPANYRPTPLMNCILKLWTSILTIIGTQTAESEGIFSDTSDGFRFHRNIYDSISTHITMYEDAKLYLKTYTLHTRT